MALSPNDFQARYKNLTVSAIPPKGTEANRFTLTGLACQLYVMTGNAEFTAASPEIDKATQNRKMTNAEWRIVGNVRGGKGTPEEMEAILRMVIENGTVPPDPDKVRAYAAKALGVDCTGFACSYYEQFDGSLNGKKVNLGCGHFFGRRQATGLDLVWSGDYAQSGDCVLWMHADGKESRKPGHIAVIDSTTGNELFTVQSGSTKAGGPARSRLTIDKIVHRKVVTDPKTGGTFDEAFYLKLTDIDPITGAPAEVVIVRPYAVA